MKFFMGFICFFSTLYADPRQDAFAAIYSDLVSSNPYYNTSQNLVGLVYSGTPGMNEEMLSVSIQDAFQGLVISHDFLCDEIRAQPASLGLSVFGIDMQDLVTYCVNRLINESPNQRLIFTRSIDQDLSFMQSLFATYNIPIIVTRLNPPYSIVEARVNSSTIYAMNFLGDLTSWYECYNDYVLSNNWDNLFDPENDSLSVLFEELTTELE